MGSKGVCNTIIVVVKISSLFLVPFGIYLLFQTGGRRTRFAEYIETLQQHSKVTPRSISYHHESLLQRYHGVCLAHGKELFPSNITMLVNHDNTVSFCTTDGVANTFWTGAMVLTSGVGTSRTDKSQHNSGINNESLHDFKVVNFDNDASKLEKSFRFIFTEDPYVRLFYIYVDMFVLPEAWFTHRVKISRLRDLRSDIAKFDCFPDVTFTEFIRLVLSEEDKQWKPVSGICNPCRIRPQFIGKMEHFEMDAAFILQSEFATVLNSTSIIKNMFINSLNFQFQLREKSRDLRKCLSRLSHLKLMWKSFHLKGYFTSAVKFPESMFMAALRHVNQTRLANQLRAIFLHAFEEHPVSVQSARGNMLHHLKEYYKDVNGDLLLRLTRKYKLDFEMFDYDHFPSDIFIESFV